VDDQAEPSTNKEKKVHKQIPPIEANLLPVSLICGFLGAGKTTLLKHVLETKHEEEGFKCAVIVNDMAALNIDKSLIDQSALVQSDEVIAMQNGCFCCTLKSDLEKQIIELANKKMFNYMLIEASGVSEPSQIAPMFDLCDDDDDEHDHENDHDEGPQLGELARLDTCITVIDAAEFYNNLGSMRHYEEGEVQGNIAELMVEQVEFSNVVILNKQDLVNEEQQADILDRITILNPEAKIIKSCQSKVNVMEILNTRLYEVAPMEENSMMLSGKVFQMPKIEPLEKTEPENTKSCCKKSLEEEGRRCCASKMKNGQLLDSGLSQVFLGVVSNNDNSLTRHEVRFKISSFVYRSRRPFHPGRLYDSFLNPFFMTQFTNDETPDSSKLVQIQKEASSKQDKRSRKLGGLMRSKGFVWIASRHYIMGGWQQAGNVLSIHSEGPWMCELRDEWEGTPLETMVLKEMNQENGKPWPYEDRRQALVFIGKDLDHKFIQTTLDKCLLQDVEMEMGPEEWEELRAVDKITRGMDDNENDDDEEEEEEDSVDDDEEEEDDEENEVRENGGEEKEFSTTNKEENIGDVQHISEGKRKKSLGNDIPLKKTKVEGVKNPKEDTLSMQESKSQKSEESTKS